VGDIVRRGYQPADKQDVFDISNASGLEPYDISELDELFSSWPEGQHVAYDAENEKTVGFLSGRIHRPETNRIYMFAVMPGYRSRGIGQLLLDGFFSLSRDMGSDVILEVRASNGRARRLYDSNGFVEVCRISGMYASGEEAVRMKKEITFITSNENPDA